MAYKAGRNYILASGGGTTPVDPDPVDPGTPTQDIMKLVFQVSGATTPILTPAIFKYNKELQICFRFDDVLINQYTQAYPLFKTFKTNDGTNSGKNINYRGSLACIAGAVRDVSGESNAAAYSWPHVKEMCVDDPNYWCYQNHTYYHGGSPTKWDNLDDIKKAEIKCYQKTGLRPITMATPAANLGILYTAQILGYLKNQTSQNEGNGSITAYGGWGDYASMKKTYQSMDIQFRSDSFDQAGVNSMIDFLQEMNVDYMAGEKYMWQYFGSHGPGDISQLTRFLNAIKTKFGDNVWFPGFQESWEYQLLKDYAVITKSLVGNLLTITIDQTNVPPNFRDRGMSLLGTGFTIQSLVSKEGLDDVTFNPTTGLINTFKINTSKIVDPSTDVLPARIIKLTPSGNNVIITYDKAVTQSMFAAYTIPNRTATGISGSGTSWTVAFSGGAITAGMEMKYRQYNGTDSIKGNAATVGTGKLVCDYVTAEGGGMPITA